MPLVIRWFKQPNCMWNLNVNTQKSRINRIQLYMQSQYLPLAYSSLNTPAGFSLICLSHFPFRCSWTWSWCSCETTVTLYTLTHIPSPVRGVHTVCSLNTVFYHFCPSSAPVHSKWPLSLLSSPSPSPCPPDIRVLACSAVWHVHDVLTDGCPGLCNNNGRCILDQNVWHCICQSGWRGLGCDVATETLCSDGKDNEGGRKK